MSRKVFCCFFFFFLLPLLQPLATATSPSQGLGLGVRNFRDLDSEETAMRFLGDDDDDDGTFVMALPYSRFCKKFSNSSEIAGHELKTFVRWCIQYMVSPPGSVIELKVPPPNVTTVISIQEIAVSNFQLLGRISDKQEATAFAEGAVVLTWKDERIRWDRGVWKFDELVLDEMTAWSPKFQPKGERSRSIIPALSSVALTSRGLRSTSEGTLEKTYDFYTSSVTCKYSHTAYPSQSAKCCFPKMGVARISDQLVVAVDPRALKTKDFDISSRWVITSTSVQMAAENETETKFDSLLGRYVRTPVPSSTLTICLNLARPARAASTEAKIPVAISAVLLLVSCSMPSWTSLLATKFFAVFVHLYAFQFTAQETNFEEAEELPPVYVFYEFTVVMSLISLILSSMLWTFSRKEFHLPPPHRLTLMTNVINVCLKGKVRKHEELLEEASLWEDVIAAVHRLVTFLIVVIYVIGVIVLSFSGL